MQLSPYLIFEGNAEDVLHFYKEAFGGTITTLSRYSDGPESADESWNNKIMHSRLEFDGNLLMISDGYPGYRIPGQGNVQLNVEIETAEKLQDVFAKMSLGANVAMPLAEQFWGATFGMLVDRFGIQWMFNHTPALH